MKKVILILIILISVVVVTNYFFVGNTADENTFQKREDTTINEGDNLEGAFTDFDQL